MTTVQSVDISGQTGSECVVVSCSKHTELNLTYLG